MANWKKKHKVKECPISHEEKYILFLEKMITFIKEGGKTIEPIESFKFKLSKARLKLKLLTNK